MPRRRLSSPATPTKRDIVRFERAYDDHTRALLGYALRRTASTADAADAVAETMLVAWRRLPDLPPEPDTRLWLYGIARNVIANGNRSNRRRSRLAEKLVSQLAETHLDSDAFDAAPSGRVRDALSRLTPIQREIILLTATEGLTPADIATVLDLNPNTVRTHLRRGRLKMQRSLTDPEPDAVIDVQRQPPAGHDSAERQSLRLPCRPGEQHG